jgi:hypothetical protein
MIIDATYFGYGVGLVIVGWVCGQVVAVILSALSNKGMR